MRTRRHSHAGFTLLELMQTSLILSIVLGIGLPQLSKINAHFQNTSLNHETLAYLKQNRADAALRNSVIVSCTLEDNECIGIENHLTSFIDNNKNKKLDDNETVIRQLPFKALSVHWSRKGKAIQFLPDGQARGHNGTLTVCSAPNKGFKIVISKTGRIRKGSSNEICKETEYQNS